jgi:hypothetical protein
VRRCGRERAHGPLLATMTRRAQMCISGNSFSRSRGNKSRDLTRTVPNPRARLPLSLFASWQNQLQRTAAQNVAQSLESHLNRCIVKPLSMHSFTFTPAPLQKSKGSSKRKATEKEASDSDDDDAQLSEETQRPSVKTVKTVKKVCENTRITCQSGSCRTTAKNFLQE